MASKPLIPKARNDEERLNTQDSLILQVIDNGPGISVIGGKTSNEFVASGVGINNIRNRLEQLYDNNYELSFSNVSPRGLSVTMRIPNED